MSDAPYAPPSLRAVIYRVQSWVCSQRRAKQVIAAAAGIAPNTLGRIEAPSWRPTLRTLERLEALVPAEFDPPAAPCRNAMATANENRN